MHRNNLPCAAPLKNPNFGRAYARPSVYHTWFVYPDRASVKQGGRPMVAPTEARRNDSPGVQGPKPLVGEGVRESREPRGNLNVPQPFGLSIVPVHLLTAGVLWPWRSGQRKSATGKGTLSMRIHHIRQAFGLPPSPQGEGNGTHPMRFHLISHLR